MAVPLLPQGLRGFIAYQLLRRGRKKQRASQAGGVFQKKTAGRLGGGGKLKKGGLEQSIKPFTAGQSYLAILEERGEKKKKVAEKGQY